MKTKTITLAILALFTLLFSLFTQAEVIPEKIIAVSGGVVVEKFYNNNKNYRLVFTKKALNYKVCLLNPEHFKECSEYEFRHMSSNKTWYFPALPEIKINETIRWTYDNNEIYRTLFKSFTKYQKEVCKNNGGIKSACTAKTLIHAKTKITLRPLTYLLRGENSHTVIVGEKTFIKRNGGYYLLTQTSIIKETQTGEINTQKDALRMVLLTSVYSPITRTTTQETFNTAENRVSNPYSFLCSYWYTKPKNDNDD